MDIEFVKVKIFGNQIEINFFIEVFEESNIPHYIKSLIDTAYDKIYTNQFGLAELYVRKDYLNESLELIKKIENSLLKKPDPFIEY